MSKPPQAAIHSHQANFFQCHSWALYFV